MSHPIAYVARFIPEYRRPILEKLNEQLDGRLVVCAGMPPDTSFKDLASGSNPSYHQVQLKNRWFAQQRVLLQNSSSVFACNPSVILAEESPRTLSLPCLLGAAKRKKIGTLLWGHFSSNERPFSTGNLQDRYRISLAKRVDGCVCYTDEIAALIRPYVPSERCFVARNTLDTDTLFRLRQSLATEGKKRVRARLGLPESGKIVVFIGRLIASKRPHMLLDLHNALNKIGRAALVVIGDGPERDTLMTRIKDERITDVVLRGALPNLEDSAPWIYAADVMVCPGYVGLNVNHAFCLGLPIVTCTSPDPTIRYHSPEISYIQDGINGLKFQYGDITSLVDTTLAVLENQNRFSKHAIEFAQSHLRSSQMIDGLNQAITYAESRFNLKQVHLTERG